jgi:hypothetical protein
MTGVNVVQQNTMRLSTQGSLYCITNHPKIHHRKDLICFTHIKKPALHIISKSDS